MFRLLYIGDGEHYVIGVPMSYVEVDDLDDALRLAETGLYEIIEGDKPDPDSALSGADTAPRGQE